MYLGLGCLQKTATRQSSIWLTTDIIRLSGAGAGAEGCRSYLLLLGGTIQTQIVRAAFSTHLGRSGRGHWPLFSR